MDAIVGNRGEGKTMKLVAWAAADVHRVIVGADDSRVEQIREMLREHLAAAGDEDSARRATAQVVSTSRMLRGLPHGRSRVEVAVDDLDAVLRSIFREPVRLVTFTGHAEEIGRAKEVAAAELIRMLDS